MHWPCESARWFKGWRSSAGVRTGCLRYLQIIDGTTHLLVADALLELGNAQVQVGNASEAVSMLNVSHTIFERELGMESAAAAKAMRSLGVAKGSLGEVDSAVVLLEGACKIFKLRFGPSHVQVETAKSALLQLATALPEERPPKKARLE